MELTKFLGLLAAVLPLAYGAPSQTATSLHPNILAAMKRDLGMDADQATSRVTREISAVEVIDHLRTSAGESFAGAWVADDGNTINIAVTDEAAADEVTAAGATPVIMSNSLSKLEKAKLALDNMEIVSTLDTESSSAASGIAAWYVDFMANKVVLEALEGSTAQAKQMAMDVGLTESEFEVRTVEEMPTSLATIQGGDAYIISNIARCSVGFTVTNGFVSAGHCGSPGDSVTTTSGQSLGTFSGSVFPGSADMSYIRTVSGTILRGYINNYGGGSLPVTGSAVAAVGSSICRSGSTTGVHCGTVRSTGVTVNYSQGRVTGLTGTNACAEPGDSGGPFYSGSQAQGVTSGGSGNCNVGGTTFFQPVNEILSTYGLTLVTA